MTIGHESMKRNFAGAVPQMQQGGMILQDVRDLFYVQCQGNRSGGYLNGGGVGAFKVCTKDLVLSNEFQLLNVKSESLVDTSLCFCFTNDQYASL